MGSGARGIHYGHRAVLGWLSNTGTSERKTHSPGDPDGQPSPPRSSCPVTALPSKVTDKRLPSLWNGQEIIILGELPRVMNLWLSKEQTGLCSRKGNWEPRLSRGTSSITVPEDPGDWGSEPGHCGGSSLAPESHVLSPTPPPLEKGKSCSQFPAWHPYNQVSGEELLS